MLQSGLTIKGGVMADKKGNSTFKRGLFFSEDREV